MNDQEKSSRSEKDQRIEDLNKWWAERETYEYWLGSHFHRAAPAWRRTETGYSVVNQCGTLVRIPEYATPFEKGVLYSVRSAQTLLNAQGDDFQLVFEPAPSGQGYPTLEVRFQGTQLLLLTLIPGPDESREFFWSHENYRIPLDAPHPLFAFWGSPTAIAIWVCFMAVYAEWGTIRQAIRESNTYQHFMSVMGDELSGEMYLSEDEARNAVPHILYYGKALDDAIKEHAKLLEGPDDDYECFDDGDCSSPCPSCEFVRHEQKRCYRACEYCAEDAKK